ncbi:MAG: amino acid permease [Ignavibacteriota bacterium]
MLLSEAGESGEHSLKRTLGVFQLTALGVGAIIGAGIFVMAGLGAHYAGPGLMLSFVLSGLGCAFAGLCYAEFAAMIPLAGSAYTYAYATLGEIFAWIIGWDLTLEYAMGASTVSSGWSNHFIELLNIFHIKMPLWLAYDHWTALKTAETTIARQIASSDGALVPGTQEFMKRVADIMEAQSPDLLQRAHALLGAPHIFGFEFGFNLPALLIALVITAILTGASKRAHASTPQSSPSKSRWCSSSSAWDACTLRRAIGARAGRRSRPSAWAASARGRLTSFSPISVFDAVSTTAQEAKNPQRDLPIGIIASLLICTFLYISVAAVLTGMVPWRNINIEAPIAQAFLDRGLYTASHVITLGALAGLSSVMLVMLLGQTRVLYAMANDGLLPRKFFADIHPKFRTPWKNTILVGCLAAVVGSVHANRRHRQDGEHRGRCWPSSSSRLQ